MTADFQTLLPENASLAMRAVEQTSGERWDLDVDIIRRFKDPWACPVHLLNFLAYERSVDVWNENWPEWKKRAVIAAAPHDHRLKGTEEGIRRYIRHAGGKLLKTITPPQGFFLGVDLTKEQWDGWISQMPRLRITLGHGIGTRRRRRGVFTGMWGLGRDAFRVNDGPALYGRRAYLRTKVGGEDIPLQLSSVANTTGELTATVEERVIVPGRAPDTSAIMRWGIGRSFLGAEIVAPRFYSYSLNRQYVHRESKLSLTAVPIGLEPLDTRYYRISDVGTAGPRAFANRWGLGRNGLGRNDGGQLLADILYLHDPEVIAPVVRGRSFLGRSRLGFPAFTADMMVEVPRRVRRYRYLSGGMGALGRVALRPNDQSHTAFVKDAIVSSKALRDQVRVTFQTTRLRTLAEGYPLDGSAKLGDRVPNFI